MTDRETHLGELAEKHLPAEVLERFRERAGVYDRENRFFDEDLEELKSLGYLTLFVPRRLRGSRTEPARGLPTPAATGLGGTCHRAGDQHAPHVHRRGQGDATTAVTTPSTGSSTRSMAGEIFAFGISEPSNDWVLQGSTTEAVPTADGGYLNSPG